MSKILIKNIHTLYQAGEEFPAFLSGEAMSVVPTIKNAYLALEDGVIVAYGPMIKSDSPIWAETGATQMSLDELLQHSDVVSLHTPLTKDTRHLINAERIALMKKQGILINTSRGGIVDEPALVTALQAGKLRGAALDVFEDEPVKAGNSLPDMPNLILTPHIAGLTQEANERVSGVIAEKVMGYLVGG